MIPGVKKRGLNFTDLVMYMALAMKHLRLIVLSMCLSMSAGLVYYVYAKPVYHSKALILYQYLALPGDSETIHNDSGVRILLNQLTAPHILARTSKKLGITGANENLYHEPDLIRKVTPSFNSEQNIELDVWSVRPDLVSTFPEAMVREYLLYREEAHQTVREARIKSYAQVMKQMYENMQQVQLNRQMLQQTNESSKLALELDQLKEVPRQLYAVGLQLAEAESARKALEFPDLDIVKRLSILTEAASKMNFEVGQYVSESDFPGTGGKGKEQIVVLTAPSVEGGAKSWEDLDRERRSLQHEVAEKGKIYRDGHRVMIALNQALAKVNSALSNDLETAQARFDQKYELLKGKKKELDLKFPDFVEADRKSQKLKQDSELFSQSQAPWEKWFTDLQRETKALEWGSERERVQLRYYGLTEVQDQRPVAPNRFKLLLMSLGMGLALGIGLPFLIEFLDHTVNNVEEIEQTFQIRGLGIVPKIDTGDFESRTVVDTNSKASRHLLENFRVIRTNLVSHGMVTKIPHVIMVASAMPQEGKTVVSTNLAVSFAHMGEKTLLIDADLRRGRLHRVFGCKSKPGLSNVLMEKMPVEDAIRKTANENLVVLPCGQHIEGATELLGGMGFSQLLDELKQKYQRIVIDTPPVLGLPETSMMQSLVDGVVFVIWSGRTPYRSVKTAIEILNANHANFYGFVLNRLDLSTTTNYYHYYYYSSYYYKSYQALEKV